VVAGLIASALIGCIYFTPIAVIIMKLLHRKKVEFKWIKALVAFWPLTLMLVALAEALLSPVLMMFASSFVVLETLITSAVMAATKIMGFILRK